MMDICNAELVLNPGWHGTYPKVESAIKDDMVSRSHWRSARCRTKWKMRMSTTANGKSTPSTSPGGKARGKGKCRAKDSKGAERRRQRPVGKDLRTGWRRRLPLQETHRRKPWLSCMARGRDKAPVRMPGLSNDKHWAGLSYLRLGRSKELLPRKSARKAWTT